LIETPETDYATRTRLNVQSSAATLILTSGAPDGGTALTECFCRQASRPCLVIDAETTVASRATIQLLRFLAAGNFASLNVAGPRESGWPAGYAYAREVLDLTFTTWDQADSRSALVSWESEVNGGPHTDPLQQ
jgi:hypothetical protein